MKPAEIPSDPAKTYGKEWNGWGDWLGTGTVAYADKEYRSFEEARSFVYGLQLKSSEEWKEYSKSNRKPSDIPADPRYQYKYEWEGMGDWLGTGTIASYNKRFRPFAQAREFVHRLGLENWSEWEAYCKSGNKPTDIPSSPERVYENEWTWWSDWLGYEEKQWSVRKVKNLLSDLIRSKIIYQWEEAVLYSFLLRKGLLNLSDHSRHQQFFKNLIEASRTYEGLKAIEDYANSDSEIPPDLSKIKETVEDTEKEEEIESASPQELSSLVENSDPLDYDEV